MTKQPNVKQPNVKHLVFVYNADSGMFNTLTDIAHKVFSPSTYSCNLCAISHSYFSERDEWKEFIEQLGAECEFLHRDEFEKKYQLTDYTYPTVFFRSGTQLEVALDADDINECDSMTMLKEKISLIV
ncbi:MAG: hypothetical protein OQK75_05210 [Gammaproteobacteria bacterium]|nr:hypothetical protein [Gammaproteobacteria bacterium]MCW9030477.1 hypothetical protein [Gammaproteobacteria bacterium]